MNHHEIMVTEDIWRRLPPELRAGLRRVLKRKASIIDHTVLAVAFSTRVGMNRRS